MTKSRKKFKSKEELDQILRQDTQYILGIRLDEWLRQKYLFEFYAPEEISLVLEEFGLVVPPSQVIDWLHLYAIRLREHRSPSQYRSPYTPKDQIMADYRESFGNLSYAKRFSIMKRDSFSCRLCGKGAMDRTVIAVFRLEEGLRHGRNQDDNLWTLCRECHIGIGDDDIFA